MASRLPSELLTSLQHIPGFTKESFVSVHENSEQVISVRINPRKFKVDPASHFEGAVKVPWSDNGYYLPKRPSFTLDPLLHAGAYYVQEASSMFLERCLKQHAQLDRSLNVLDLCGAPGGKSTLQLSTMNDHSLLVSNEVIKTRVNVLSENITKWGAANVIVTNNDPADFSRLGGFFDVMIVDAPCSGSGLFRRDADAIDHWSMDAVHMCSLRQQRILADAYVALKKGGLLVYSTCSFSREEDEDICDWLHDNFRVTSLEVDVAPEWNIIETKSAKHSIIGYRFFPDKLKGEGFFVACMRKEDGSESVTPLRSNRKVEQASAKDASSAGEWMEHPQAYSFFNLDEQLYAFPAALTQQLFMVHSQLYIKKAGVLLGKMINNALVPDHELAVSDIVKRNLPSILLNKDEALQYLRKEEVRINNNQRGWALVIYREWRLGWMKLLGNRSNNYYPKEWRILKSGNN